MPPMFRGFGAVLASAFLWPAIGSAIPIGGPAGASGWANEHGNFVVDTGGATLVTGSVASYSAASSLFSTTSSYIAFSGGSTHFQLTPGEMHLDAVVGEDGTISGDLVGGTLTVRADADGIPEAGIAGGDLLLVAHAIDAAALDAAFNTLFLFAIDYAHTAFSSLGDYVTYAGPYSGSWGHAQNFDPWGHDWSGNGFTFADFYQTRQVPEPGTLALFSLALAGLALNRRRQNRLRR